MQLISKKGALKEASGRAVLFAHPWPGARQLNNQNAGMEKIDQGEASLSSGGKGGQLARSLLDSTILAICMTDQHTSGQTPGCRLSHQPRILACFSSAITY